MCTSVCVVYVMCNAQDVPLVLHSGIELGGLKGSSRAVVGHLRLLSHMWLSFHF